MKRLGIGLLGLALAGCTAGGSGETAAVSCDLCPDTAEASVVSGRTFETPPAEVPAADVPFASLHLEISACMSCAHCRGAVRSAERRLEQGELDVAFEPRSIDTTFRTAQRLAIPDRIREIERIGIRALVIREVRLTASGVLHTEGDRNRLVLDGTGESFPVRSVPPAWIGKPVRIEAQVLDWEREETLSLSLISVTPRDTTEGS